MWFIPCTWIIDVFLSELYSYFLKKLSFNQSFLFQIFLKNQN